MIESGLLEWLIGHLHDKCHIMSLYRLEYATALLMNLSLHRLAQARASKISSLLVSTLLILLSIDHTSVSKVTRIFNGNEKKNLLEKLKASLCRLLVTTVHQWSIKQFFEQSCHQRGSKKNEALGYIGLSWSQSKECGDKVNALTKYDSFR